MRLELLKPGIDYHREVRFLVAVGNGNRLVNAIVAQRGSNLWARTDATDCVPH